MTHRPEGPAYCINYLPDKGYLFNQYAVDQLFIYLNNNGGWKIPLISDWFKLFHHLDECCNYNYWTESIAKEIRGNYGWPRNGTNKCGFNAYPNVEPEYARWWTFDDHNHRTLSGMALYPDDIVSEFGVAYNSFLAIRLVRDLTEPKIEEGILYV
jgi:uncharacterized protein (TIGR02145 family)